MCNHQKNLYGNLPDNFKGAVALIVTCFLLISCGGSSSNSVPIAIEAPVNKVPSPIPDVISIDEQAFSLLSTKSSESLSLQAYWPANNDVPVGFLEMLDSMLAQLHRLFEQSYFSFAQSANYTSNNNLLKSIVFTPLSQENDLDVKEDQTKYRIIDASTIQVYFLTDTALQQDKLMQPLIANIYQSERRKYHANANEFEALLSQGLALHFIEDKLTPSSLFVEKNFTSDEEKQSTIALVKAFIEDDVNLDEDFLSQGISWQLGYFLAEQHFTRYPGSDASNSFSLPRQLFSYWLDADSLSMKKNDSYVRTGDVADQVAVAELARQAIKFPGGYFLEGANKDKLISLTFDDGPSAYTEKILSVLNRYNIPASFFWQGKNLEGYQTLVQEVINAGHTVANHSWNHANGMNYTPAELWQQQIINTNDEFQTRFGITPRFYRPPYGEITDEQVSFLLERGMKVLLWSVDSRDWNPSLNSVSNIESEIINHQHEEAISLMHDAGGNRQNTVDSLSAIIEHYHAQGYRFVNVETLLGISDKH